MNTNKENRFTLKKFKDIEPKDVEWLWYPYFALGKLSFLAGDPGIGKSFITTFLASVVSNGEYFPYTTINVTQGNVIIQNGEDGTGDTIKKRLFSFRANEDNIYMIDLKDDNEENGDYLTLSDVKVLDKLFSEIHPKLVIFDPITVFLGDVNMNDAPKVRRLLKPIGKLAEKHNCAVIMVIHLNKGLPGGNPLYRMLGSIDFAGIARSVISLVKGKNEVLFAQVKNNLAEKGKTLAFEIKDGKINWLGERDYTEELEDIDTTTSQREIARCFILDYLGEYQKAEYRDLLLGAEKQGISKKTLERARDELKQENMIDKKYMDKKTYWYLKEKQE